MMKKIKKKIKKEFLKNAKTSLTLTDLRFNDDLKNLIFKFKIFKTYIKN